MQIQRRNLHNYLAYLGVALLLSSCQFLSRTRPPATSASGLPAIEEGQWQSFSPPEGRFTIAVPAQPTQAAQTLNTAAGPIVAHIYQVNQGSIAYTVMYNDYPADVVAELNPQDMFNNARNNALKNQSGKLLNERDISLNTYPGRELKIMLPGNIIAIARMYLVKQRLYQAIVTAKPELDTSPGVDRFLDSLKLN